MRRSGSRPSATASAASGLIVGSVRSVVTTRGSQWLSHRCVTGRFTVGPASSCVPMALLSWPRRCDERTAADRVRRPGVPRCRRRRRTGPGGVQLRDTADSCRTPRGSVQRAPPTRWRDRLRHRRRLLAGARPRETVPARGAPTAAHGYPTAFSKRWPNWSAETTPAVNARGPSAVSYSPSPTPSATSSSSQLAEPQAHLQRLSSAIDKRELPDSTERAHITTPNDGDVPLPIGRSAAAGASITGNACDVLVTQPAL